MGFLKSLRIVIKCKGLPAQLPAPCINCSDIMCLTANVTSKDQHIIVNERELIIFAEFPLSLKISPGEGFHLTEYSVCFFYHLPLFLYIHHRIDLIRSEERRVGKECISHATPRAVTANRAQQ